MPVRRKKRESGRRKPESGDRARTGGGPAADRGADRPSPGTLCVHGAGPAVAGPPAGEPVTSAILQTTTYRFGTPEEMLDVFLERKPGFVYSRYENPTVAAVESKLAALEGTQRALLFSSGMAAITTVLLHLCEAGDRILAQRDLYGGTHAILTQVLPRAGVTVDWADPDDDASLLRSLRRRPKVIYFESPSNPLLRIADGPRLCRLAREAGVTTVFDSTFGTPILQRPSSWGVDLVVHSGSKYLGGHHDLTCGVVAGAEALIGRLSRARRLFGGVVEAWSAFLLDRGLKTLEVRVLRESASALELARRLEEHPKVRCVHYPGLRNHPQHDRARALLRGGFGGVLAFEVRGGRPAAMRCLGGLRRIQLATSLGGVETLISHPATSSHLGLGAAGRRERGIGEGLLRLAVGLEGPEDLWLDLRRGLDRA